MEVKINREIRSFKERIFLGLTLRQLLICGIGLLLSVGSFFQTEPLFGRKIAVYLVMLIMAPFAAAAFVRYHGMNAFEVVAAWLRLQLTPRNLLFVSRNRLEILTEDIDMELKKAAEKQKRKHREGRSKKKKGEIHAEEEKGSAGDGAA